MYIFSHISILGDSGADSGDEGKSKRAEKCGAKKSKERREEPLGTMSYQTNSKRSPSFWLLIGARKLVFFCGRLDFPSPPLSAPGSPRMPYISKVAISRLQRPTRIRRICMRKQLLRPRHA